MAGIGSRNTQPELLVRRQLHAHGLRFVLDGAGLPGRPDLVLPKWRAAIFVHGCFWHRHGCALSRMPASNVDFWSKKLDANEDRDAVSLLSLISGGWRVATVWECALRGQRAQSDLSDWVAELVLWLRTRPRSFALEIPRAPKTRKTTKKEREK